LKEEAKIHQQYDDMQAQGQDGNTKRVRQTEHLEVNEMLELWVTKAMSDDIQLNGEILRQKWNRFANMKGVPEDERLTLSDGWLTALKRRCGLQNFKQHGEAGSANCEDIECECEHLRKLIAKHGYQLKDIFNMDKIGLFGCKDPFFPPKFKHSPSYRMPPDRGLMNKQTSGVKGCKKRLTYAFTLNATGSDDEHGHAVHHRNVHSTHSRLTQNNAFRQSADALGRHSLILPKLYCRSALLH
jgi:hypothetical protein